jgi:hypothetical protein
MAQLLNVLVTLDEIIANNDVIGNSWGKKIKFYYHLTIKRKIQEDDC